MKPLAGREFVRVGEAVRLSVPVHGNQPLKAGLKRHLAKAAGLPDDFNR